MASHLGRTVQEARATLTSTEFLKWVWFLDWQTTEEFSRQDYYMAQIAAQIERGQSKRPNSVTVESKLLKFISQPRPRDKQSQIQRSKNFWMGVTGIHGDKRRRRRRTPPIKKGGSSK